MSGVTDRHSMVSLFTSHGAKKTPPRPIVVAAAPGHRLNWRASSQATPPLAAPE